MATVILVFSAIHHKMYTGLGSVLILITSLAFLHTISIAEGACDIVNALGLSPIVALSTGSVQGLSCLTVLALPYFSFRGIPYATPPLRQLRFRAPRPPAEWGGVLQATKEPPTCNQPSRYVSFPVTFSEDCLYINVFTPSLKRPDNKLLPVIMWVNGGKYSQGSGSSYKYGPDFLLEKEVIIVTLNYRLGVFGNLNMNIAAAQGNAAMKDMLAALRWVQREIHNFGGDPKLVTIFGGSSAAGAVNLLYISPMARGLFQRAISHSGSALCEWNFRASNVDVGLELARSVGCNSSTSEAIVDCLQRVNATDLAEKQMMFKDVFGAENSFLPSLEGYHGEEVFMPVLPDTLFDQAPPIPYILGVNSGEGLYFVKDNPSQFTNLKENMINYLPLHLLKDASKPEGPLLEKEFLQAVDAFYFKNFTITFEEIGNGFVDYMSDNNFIYCTLKAAQKISLKAPTYLFYFNYNGAFIPPDKGYLKLNISFSEVCHGDELGYFFYRNYTVPEHNYLYNHPRDMNLVDRVTTIWTDFAAYGNPTPFPQDVNSSWLPVTNGYTRYMSIGDVIQMSHKPLLENRMRFWDSFYSVVSLLQEISTDYMPTHIPLFLTVFIFLAVAVYQCAEYIKRKGYTVLK